MARNELHPVVKLRSTAGTGYTYVTRKNRRNDPDRLVLRKFDPLVRRHVDFREDADHGRPCRPRPEGHSMKPGIHPSYRPVVFRDKAAGLALVESDEADDEDRVLLRQLHPTARQAAAGSRELTRLALAGFDVEAAGAAQHPACALLPQEADEAGVSTLVWRRHRPFHPERLYEALEDLTCAAARSRGRFWLADRPDTLLSWDAAGGALCVENTGPWLAALPDAAWDLVPPFRRAAAALDWHPEHGDCCQHLVFVSPGLDRDALTELLDSCLLADDEYAAGREAWKSLPAAFDSLLDPVR